MTNFNHEPSRPSMTMVTLFAAWGLVAVKGQTARWHVPVHALVLQKRFSFLPRRGAAWFLLVLQNKESCFPAPTVSRQSSSLACLLASEKFLCWKESTQYWAGSFVTWVQSEPLQVQIRARIWRRQSARTKIPPRAVRVGLRCQIGPKEREAIGSTSLSSAKKNLLPYH